jgi:hypothetical protein
MTRIWRILSRLFAVAAIAVGVVALLKACVRRPAPAPVDAAADQGRG